MVLGSIRDKLKALSGYLFSYMTHVLIPASPFVSVSPSDINPKVNFYWRRGQRIIPSGYRRGRLEPTRFQIDDCPHSQIRITQQLPQVENRS